MTRQQAEQLKTGDTVYWCGIKATVRGVRSNGVLISHWGQGLQEGEWVSRRVSASMLSAGISA